MSDQLVELGFCVRPHGIKGGFIFTLHNMEESVLEDGSVVTLIPSKDSSSIVSGGTDFTISKISFGNKVIVYLEGIDSRDQVEAMIPFSVSIPRSAFPATEDSEYYVTDLIGINLFDYKSRKFIGSIDNFYENNIQIVFVIKLENGEIIDIPFVNEFFPEIDLDKNRGYIILPEEV